MRPIPGTPARPQETAKILLSFVEYRDEAQVVIPSVARVLRPVRFAGAGDLLLPERQIQRIPRAKLALENNPRRSINDIALGAFSRFCGKVMMPSWMLRDVARPAHVTMAFLWTILSLGVVYC